MASPFKSAVMPVWQDPFVEVIKFGMTHRNVGWHTQGDVEQIQDQHIHKNVFKIRGAIAATNYLRVPRDAVKGTHGLGLTGRYAYLQFGYSVDRCRARHDRHVVCLNKYAKLLRIANAVHTNDFA
ncbi:hypothetical protein JG688_00004059 [Phytophthora aleatoria]|uniref:CFA20 domain-containing protein n=1 Tax=Phytophthora aleatoria TaxID=2496075 RepID=A0A8J5M7K2_9STRA|nr:hypothetical protein JG688_00004059 [Phytophthora aleatoria]